MSERDTMRTEEMREKDKDQSQRQGNNNRPLAAHLRDDGEGGILVQTIDAHNHAVAVRAGAYADDFGAGSLGYACGALHDYGKATARFQKRIWDHSARVDHSTAGAFEILSREYGKTIDSGNPRDLKRLFAKRAALLAAYCIAGHHAGLPDGGDLSCAPGTLTGRLHNWDNKDILQVETTETMPLSFPPLKCDRENAGFSLSCLTRMIFSCLVDADYLDTEEFMTGRDARKNDTDPIPILCSLFADYIEKNNYLKGTTELNKERAGILTQCIEAGKNMIPGIKTLSVPTGGGKTVSSLAFSLYHAQTHNKKRIIYVIPYCSVIDQTVEVFKTILGEKNVLAHYSDITPDDDEAKENMRRLACENWDVPLIVTTGVQFFESFFSNRSSACRKLHNLAESIIIFDEAQTIPNAYLLPCVSAICELTANYGSTCVLCTATQPSLDELVHGYNKALKTEEICPGVMEQKSGVFQRVTYINEGLLTDEELAERLTDSHQVLCIVGSRKHARELFELIEGEGAFHLSTLMIPADRKRTIREIKERLKCGQACRVVSTSLIEAGVDVDFPEVYRAEAGLDSIIQSAGRCNREGKREASESLVHIYISEQRHQLPASLKLPKEIARKVTEDIDQPDAPEVIRAYFQELHTLQGRAALDKNNILEKMNAGFMTGNYPFSTIARDFHLISEDTWSVLIPADKESRKLCEKLQDGSYPLTRMEYRKLGQYTVNVFENHFKALEGSLYVYGTRQAILINPELYSAVTGLRYEETEGSGLFF